jgi:hypothetical protein
MKPLYIEETVATPKVVLDNEKGDFLMEGCSRPEDVRAFYYPIINWLNQFIEEVNEDQVEKAKNQPVVFNFKFDYFNSSSAKFILDILLLINEIYSKGITITICWHYDSNDEDMKEVGEELSEVVDFDFTYQEV